MGSSRQAGAVRGACDERRGPRPPRGIGTSSLPRILLTCRSIVRSLRHNSSAISLLVRPLEIRRSTCSSRSRQGIACAGWPGVSRRIETRQLRLRAEPFELGPRRLVLEPCRLIVAEGTTGLPDEHAHARRLIGCLEALATARTRDRRGSSAACASPSARAIAPSACATTARRPSVSNACASSCSSSRARRASSTSPIASMISR